MSSHQPITALLALALALTGCASSEQAAEPDEQTTDEITTTVTVELEVVESTEPPDPKAVYRELTNTPPDTQPLLIVHPECRDTIAVWVEDELWRGPWPDESQLLPQEWQTNVTVPGTFEPTGYDDNIQSDVGTFTAADGTAIGINRIGAINDSCAFWE